MLGGFIVLGAAFLVILLIYDRKKPRAREVVMCAMLCALVVLVSLLFRVTIPIKAGSALVIISGISFGPAVGFLVGAISRFVLNFYEGQGLWTVWQMLCWGGLGIMGALVFKRARSLGKAPNRLLLAVFTLVSIVIFYGGIMNLFTFFNFDAGGKMSMEALLAVYATGIPYDISHGASAAVVMFLVGPALISRLERIKIKYGFYRRRRG